MAGTVFTDLAFFTGATTGQSHCDNATDWSGGSPDTESKIEGTGCLSAKVSSTTLTYTFSCTTTNLTNKCIYAWLLCITPGLLDTMANGGLRIGVRDTSNNTGDWYVGGRNTYKGGWECFVAHSGQSFNVQSGTPNLASINGIRITFKTTASVAKTNCFWDAVRNGTYIGIRGGISSDPATFNDLLSADETYAYGTFRIGTGGIIFSQAKLIFGSTTAGHDTYFKDTTSPIIVFRDRKVSSTWWNMTFQGNSTGTTEIYFGEKLGGTGVNGPIIKPENTALPYTLTLSDTNVTGYGLYGCTFFNPSTITLQAYSGYKEVNGCTFINGAEMIPDTGIVEQCRFIGASGRAIKISSDSHNVESCTFINNNVAIRHDVGGLTYTYDGLMFYGNTYDIENTASQGIFIDRVNGSNPSTKLENSGSITINPLSVALKVTVKNEAGSYIQYAKVAIQRTAADSMTGAVAYTGSYTDETTAANNSTANDMTLMRASPQVDDAYYFGGKYPFYKLRLNVGTAGSGAWTITWEYYNGSTWAAIPDIYDPTNGFKNGTGNKDIVFSPPNNWSTTTISSISAYWIRARISSFISLTTQPRGTQSWVYLQIMNKETNAYGVAEDTYQYQSDEEVTVIIRKSSTGSTRYYPVTTTQTIADSGLNLTWTLIQDKIASS
uniref:Uncharacterized protein n=1 Tax=candidate division CPR3 bacterium TaxID=2268181 RepID=A0A7C4RAW7_UNCC3